LPEPEIQFLTLAAELSAVHIDRVLEQRDAKRSAPIQAFEGFIGTSPEIKEVYKGIEMAARNAATVLVEGESGTGKELVARAIHTRSDRSENPFVAIDCGAVQDSLIETELFGSRKGAYTGAIEDRRGLFESANRGTIFLDEIANASMALQVKLLRVLQEREVRKVGDTRETRIDVRLIAATNQNLEILVADGRFRSDLLFRLKVLHIQIPPLRSRSGDIALLAEAFLEKLNRLNGSKKRFADEALQELASYELKGNVRELQNLVERMFYAATHNVIRSTEPQRTVTKNSDQLETWLSELVSGKTTFWSAVRDKYKSRAIPRDQVLELVDRGLRATKGSYKALAVMFNIKPSEYRRFMDFLRRNNCLLDFRPYRTSRNSC
jgi:transcriptional regulator with GAF, ATPase, and Fis domain